MLRHPSYWRKPVRLSNRALAIVAALILVAACGLTVVANANAKCSHGVDHVYPAHRLYETKGKRVFSPRLAHRIFLKVGFGADSRHMTEIARGESGFYPGIWGIDPGGTRGYGLTAITPGAWGSSSPLHRHLRRLGGVAAMFNPVRNARMAKVIYDYAKRAGNRWAPWYGTRWVGTLRGHLPGEVGPRPLLGTCST